MKITFRTSNNMNEALFKGKDEDFLKLFDKDVFIDCMEALDFSEVEANFDDSNNSINIECVGYIQIEPVGSSFKDSEQIFKFYTAAIISADTISVHTAGMPAKDYKVSGWMTKADDIKAGDMGSWAVGIQKRIIENFNPLLKKSNIKSVKLAKKPAGSVMKFQESVYCEISKESVAKWLKREVHGLETAIKHYCSSINSYGYKEVKDVPNSRTNGISAEVKYSGYAYTFRFDLYYSDTYGLSMLEITNLTNKKKEILKFTKKDDVLLDPIDLFRRHSKEINNALRNLVKVK